MDTMTTNAAKILLAANYKGAEYLGMDGYMNPCIYVGREPIVIEALYDTAEGNEQADVIENWLKTNCYQLWSDMMPDSGTRIEWLKLCLEQLKFTVHD